MGWLQRLLGRRADPRDEDFVPEGDPIRVAEVQTVLVALRPLLAADGGDVRLLAVEDGWVRVELRGACRSCHMSSATVQGALEPRLREACSWFRGVRTD